MIEFVDTPSRPRLHELPACPPTPAQLALIFTVSEQVSRCGLLPPGHGLNFRPVSTRGIPDVGERGSVVTTSNGRMLVTIDVELPPDLLAEVLLHECGHIRHLSDHPDFRRSHVFDAAEWRRLHEESERFADSFAKAHIGDAQLQAAIQAAQTDAEFGTRLRHFPPQHPTAAQRKIADAVVARARRQGFFEGALLQLRTVFAPLDHELTDEPSRGDADELVCFVNACVQLPAAEFADRVARQCGRAEVLRRKGEGKEAERVAADLARRARLDSAVDAAVRAAEREAQASCR